MKKGLLLWLPAAALFVVGTMTLQSCGGEGGPTGSGSGGGGGGGDNGGGFNVSQEFLNLLADDQKTASYVGSEKCAECHGGTDAGSIYANWKATKHAEVKTGCEQCHGPGSVHSATPTASNILYFPKLQSSFVCAQCHTDTFNEWTYSQHSKLIASPVEEAAHNPTTYGRNSRCVACHSGLFRTEAVDGGKDIANMTDQEIREIAENTVNLVPHVATCQTCHDPHMKTGNLTDDGQDVQLTHKTFNQDTSKIAPGTTAPTFTTFDHVCGQCHNGRGVDPSDARLTSSTSRPGMHDSNQFNMLMGLGGVAGTGQVNTNTAHMSIPGQCSHCHMGNSRHTFTVSYDSGCQPCHTAADAAARTTSIKSEILQSLYALRQRMESWAKTKFGDIDFWEYTSTLTAEGKTPPPQSQVPIEIKRSRHNYYFVIRDRCYGPHNAPYAKHLITVANQNLDALGVPGAPQNRTYNMLTENMILSILESDLERTRRGEKLPE